MNSNNLINANDQLKTLIGLRGLVISRQANLVEINFGSGESGHTLRLRCGFRIRDSHAIFVANTDIYNPSSSVLQKSTFNYDSYFWDIQGGNCFDEWVQNQSPAFFETLEVVDAKVNSIGDISIHLSQNIVIEAFIDTVDDECWRVYKTKGDNPHFIMDGNGSGYILE